MDAVARVSWLDKLHVYDQIDVRYTSLASAFLPFYFDLECCRVLKIDM